jgi:hypothetical protein
VKAGPRWISDPPELLQTPPKTEAPIQDEQMTECGSRLSGRSAFCRVDAYNTRGAGFVGGSVGVT